jgi:uridylate kinase
MSPSVKYNRVLVKLSGESLSGAGGSRIDSQAIARTTGELIAIRQAGAQVAVVVGAGNLVRGRDLDANPDIRRTTADYMGMLATVTNALALRDSLESHGAPALAMSAIPMPSVCETFNSRHAIAALEAGKIVIFGGGTGSPFFTTDTCAALRACEIGADVLIKATQVDGVFDADPKTHPNAKKYDELTYEKVLADRLGVMDLTAISLCMDSRLPIIVLASTKPDNLLTAVRGGKAGTLVWTKP